MSLKINDVSEQDWAQLRNIMGLELTPHEIVRKLMKDKIAMFSGVAPVSDFIFNEMTECMLPGKTNKADLVFNRYQKYCVAENKKALGRNNFYDELRCEGIPVKVSSGNLLYVYNYVLESI